MPKILAFRIKKGMNFLNMYHPQNFRAEFLPTQNMHRSLLPEIYPNNLQQNLFSKTTHININL